MLSCIPFLACSPFISTVLAPSVPPRIQDEIPTVIVEPLAPLSDGLPASAGTRVRVTEDDIFEQGYRTLPQALRDVPQVMVQETAHGQGSPYLRGFTGFGTLLLVDGIRLNNSAFRSGPNQYWNTVDSGSLDRLEVDLGPGSALYGSDALGGVVNAFTLSPYGEIGEPTGRLIYRFSGAGNYHMFRTEASYVGERGAVLLGLSAKDFGDVRGGEEVGRQPGTGYDETNADLKIEHWLNDNSRLVFGHYRVNQNDVPRTHRTVDGLLWEGLTRGSDLSRELDQNRELTYLQLHQENLSGPFDAMTTNVSWQTQTEERVRVRGDGRVERQGFDVGTLELFHHMQRSGPSGDWTYGLEFWRDCVDSFLDKGALQTPADDIQGPVADDASYQSLGLFVQDRYSISESTDWIAAARVSTLRADADSVRDPVSNTQTALRETYDNFSLSLEFEHRLNSESGATWYGGISQGFRAPNLSDLSRFDSARTDEFEIPAFDLEEEHVLGVEMGLRSESGRARYDVGAFFADIRDGIVRVPTGNTNAEGETEITKANVGDGHVWGLAGSLRYDLDSAVEVRLDMTIQRGGQDTFPTSAPVVQRESIDRLMPMTLHAGFRWKAADDKGWVELLLTHASAADNLSTRDQGDTSRIPVGGTPGYALLDLRSGWEINDNIDFTIGLENITNEDYRVHGSGVNGAGRGVVFGLVLSF